MNSHDTTPGEVTFIIALSTATLSFLLFMFYETSKMQSRRGKKLAGEKLL